MKHFLHELKTHLTSPSFLVSVALAVFIVSIINAIARKYVPGVKTVEDTITNAVTPSA
jgi:uncharacterized membrane protein